MALPLTPSEQSAIAAANPFEVHRADPQKPSALALTLALTLTLDLTHTLTITLTPTLPSPQP